MVTLEQGCVLGGAAIEQLQRWLESGAIHHSGLAALVQTVCLHSLLICLQKDNPA
jgi:hypothetical protein